MPEFCAPPVRHRVSRIVTGMPGECVSRTTLVPVFSTVFGSRTHRRRTQQSENSMATPSVVTFSARSPSDNAAPSG
jgi:hypothetical protein